MNCTHGYQDEGDNCPYCEIVKIVVKLEADRDKFREALERIGNCNAHECVMQYYGVSCRDMACEALKEVSES